MFCFFICILYSESLSFVQNTDDIYRKFDPATLAKAPSIELANKYANNLTHTKSLTLPIKKDGGILGRHKGYIVFLANCTIFVERMANQLIALFERHVTKEQQNRWQLESEEAQAKRKIVNEKNWDDMNQLEEKRFRADFAKSLELSGDSSISVSQNTPASKLFHQHSSARFGVSESGFEIVEETSDDTVAQTEEAKISDFTLTDVIQCANFSDAAYKISKNEPHEFLTDALHKFGTEDGLSSGFVIEKDERIYVSYKGTTKPRDLVTDFTAFWSYNGQLTGRFHMGILHAYQETATAMLTILDDICKLRQLTKETLSDRLVFTGHSLGGGLAQIAAFHWRASTNFCPKVATFAAPNVMDFLTAEKYNNSFSMRDRTLTVDQIGDPVPVINVPLITGAMHVGNKLYLPYSTEKQDDMSTITHFHGLKTYRDTLNKLSQNRKLQVTKMGFFGQHASSEVYQFEAYKKQPYFATNLANAVRSFLSAKVEANIHWLIARVFWDVQAQQTIADSGGGAAE